MITSYNKLSGGSINCIGGQISCKFRFSEIVLLYPARFNVSTTILLFFRNSNVVLILFNVPLVNGVKTTPLLISYSILLLFIKKYSFYFKLNIFSFCKFSIAVCCADNWSSILIFSFSEK